MAITISEAIQRTVEHREIFADEMTSLWMDLMTGKLTPAQIAGLIVGLRVKKETIGEITAAAKVMRDLSTKVNVRDPESLLDIVGTGGDGARTFNISTTSMFVIAAAGGRGTGLRGEAWRRFCLLEVRCRGCPEGNRREHHAEARADRAVH